MLEQENIYLNEDLHNKEEILEFIAEKAYHLGITDDKEALLKDLWKREGEYSTGIQDGFAIPHSKDKLRMSVLFARRCLSLSEILTLWRKV